MNKSSQRVSRTPPARSGPIRNYTGAEPRPSQGANAPADLFSSAGAAVCGVLENGVRTAYAVIDEYMRRGQEAARVVFNDPNRRGFMSDSRGNYPPGFNPGGAYYGGGNFGAGTYGAPNPLAMLAQQWLTMAMQAWSTAMGSMPPAQQWQQGMNMNPYGAAPQMASVAVSVSAARPVEVTANVHGYDAAGLLCDALRADAGTADMIAAPSVARDGSSVRVAVNVGANQPAGTYRAYIRRNSDGSVAGDITIVVS